MEHTFIVQEGAWQALGVYMNERGTPLQLEGEIVITHQAEIWINAGVLKILADPPIELIHRNEIKPLPAHAAMTTWTAHHPAFGMVKGTYVFVGPAIHVTYQSADDQYRGMESLTQLDADTYEATGSLLQGKTRLSSWRLNLSRSSA